MSWKETVTLKERTKFIADYLNGSYNMSELCELYGVSRKTGYKWKERFEQLGPEGLLDRSKAPRSHPKAVPESIVATILRARESHPTWGPKKLLWWLSDKNPELALPAESTCGEILKRHGLTSKRRRRRKTDPYTEPFPDFDTLKIKDQSFRIDADTRRVCASRFSFFRTVRTLGGGFIPTAQSSLYALPLISVRTHMVVSRTETGIARTS